METLQLPPSMAVLTERYPHVQELCDGHIWISSLLTSLVGHNFDTAEHSARVAIITGELASASNLNQQYATALDRAALLHDIGKLRVTASGLTLPYEKMSEVDRTHLHNHSRYSYEVIQPHDPVAANIAVAHHELQGEFSGPRNPKNADSVVQFNRRTPSSVELLTSQVMLVIADSTDAALSYRSYKGEGWTPPTFDSLYQSIAGKISPMYHHLIEPAIRSRLAID